MEMTIEATMTSKGQITVPLRFRKKLRAGSGSKIVFKELGNQVVIYTKPKFSDFYGKLDGLWGGEDPAEEIARWRSRGNNDRS
jgi:bifunctional DNA-binding transcriptional regulator/antitoxin component of YhaV-PrlF toxin-antitoxin module